MLTFTVQLDRAALALLAIRSLADPDSSRATGTPAERLEAIGRLANDALKTIQVEELEAAESPITGRTRRQ